MLALLIPGLLMGGQSVTPHTVPPKTLASTVYLRSAASATVQIRTTASATVDLPG